MHTSPVHGALVLVVLHVQTSKTYNSMHAPDCTSMRAFIAVCCIAHTWVHVWLLSA